MAKSKSSGKVITKNAGRQLKSFLLFFAIIMMAVFGYLFRGDKEDIRNVTDISSDGSLIVHFIDVGQGDAALVTSPTGESMLIDAGPGANAGELLDYLESQNLKKLEYAIFTHPHEDHIGGADDVLNRYPVDKVLMPDVTHTLKAFEKMIDAIDKNGSELICPSSGNTFKLGDAQFTVIAPNGTDYESLNDYSIVIKLVYGTNSFVFTGDAEELSEREILSRYKADDLKCDVLKAGHHGSATSSCDDFISALSPEYAVISCGEGNDYGHPHREIVEKLAGCCKEVYRTDLLGTIVMQSDGNKIKVFK